ncbi:MAG TPA: DUF5602 domain-containing protein [Alphaproteobacteria bacterium]|nr:DUF5602 domain-containing protein [Alphaproteobacteria bacterium]
MAIFTLAVGVTLRLANPFGAEARGKATQTFYGVPHAMGAGNARSYITLSGNVPVEVGVELSENALTALPSGETGHHHEMSGAHVDMTEYLLDLPEQAKVTPFKFLELDWNPHGHDPSGIYDRPHFDFHFYTITLSERDAIDPTDPDYMRKAQHLPDPKLVPASFMTPPPITPVPHMGLHWISTQADELHGKPFTQTFVRGSWNGRMVFFEPMATRAFLESKPDIVLPIADAKCFDPAGYYPTEYRIRYEPATKGYRISLSEFAYRDCEVPGTSIARAEQPGVTRK